MCRVTGVLYGPDQRGSVNVALDARSILLSIDGYADDTGHIGECFFDGLLAVATGHSSTVMVVAITETWRREFSPFSLRI